MPDEIQPVDPVLAAGSLDELVANKSFDPDAYLRSYPQMADTPGIDDLLNKVRDGRDPVLNASSKEDLINNRDFNPTQYWLTHSHNRNIPGMEDLLTEIHVGQRQDAHEHPWRSAWDAVKGSLPAAVEIGKQGWAALKAGVGMRTGARNPVKGAAELTAGLEAGFTGTVDLAGKILSQPYLMDAARRKYETPEETKDRQKREFVGGATWAEQMARVNKGEGELMQGAKGKVVSSILQATSPVGAGQLMAAAAAEGAGDKTVPSALNVPSMSAEELARISPELAPDPNVISGYSLVENPLMVAPGLGVGFGMIEKVAARLLATTAGKAVAESAIGKIGIAAIRTGANAAKSVEQTVQPSNVIARGAQAVGGTLRGVGEAAGGVSGYAGVGEIIHAGLSQGIGTGVALKVGGAAAKYAGVRILNLATRVQQRDGFLFQVLDAGLNAPVGGAARGFAAMVPLAALSDDRKTQESLLGAGLAFGAAGGAARGAVGGARVAGETAAVASARRLFTQTVGEQVASPGYGTDPALDAAHAVAMTRADPATRSVITRLREYTRNLPLPKVTPKGPGEAPVGPGRGEVYMVDDPTYNAVTGQDGSGVALQQVLSPEGTPVYRMIINRSGTQGTAFHEVGHGLTQFLQQFYPEQAEPIFKAIRQFPEANRQAFGDFYMLRRQADNPGTALPELTPDGLDKEISAEMVGAHLRGTDLSGLPQGAGNLVAQAVGSAMEKLGVYTPGMMSEGATPVPPVARTSLGLSPSFLVSQAAGKALRGVGVGPTGQRFTPADVQPIQPVFPIRPLDKFGRPVRQAAPPVIRPAKGAAPVKPPRIPGMYVQEETRKLLDQVDFQDTSSWDAVMNRIQDLNLSEGQRAALRQLYDWRNQNLGDVPPVELNYLSVKNEGAPGGAPRARPTRTERRSAQEIAYIKESLGALSEQTRALFSKLILPYRLITRGKNINILGMSPDKALGNAFLAAREALSKGRADLVPFETRNGVLTDSGAQEFARALASYSQNQNSGYSGTGRPIEVPPSYKGELPAIKPDYIPKRLSEDQSNFVNLTMGIEPPRTPRWAASRRNPVTGELITRPANIEAADLAAANKRPLAEYPLAMGEFKSKVTGETAPIMEPNPLRQEFTKAGIELDKILNEVTEEINLENIQGPIVGRPESGFRQPSTGLITAGFAPKNGQEFTAEGPDGKPVKFRFDTMFHVGDDSAMTKVFGHAGEQPQVTSLEAGAGDVPEGDSFSGLGTLREKGYKLPPEIDKLDQAPEAPPTARSFGPGGQFSPKRPDDLWINEYWLGPDKLDPAPSGHEAWAIEKFKLPEFKRDATEAEQERATLQNYATAEKAGYVRVAKSADSFLVESTSRFPTWYSLPKAYRKILENRAFETNRGVEFEGRTVIDRPRPAEESFSPKLGVVQRPGEQTGTVEPLSEVGKRLAEEGFTFHRNMDAARRTLTLSAFNKYGDLVGDIEVVKAVPGQNQGDWTIGMIDVGTRYQRRGIGEAMTREAANILQDLGATSLNGNIISGKSFALHRKVFGFEPGQEKAIAAGEGQLAAMNTGETAFTDRIGTLRSPIKTAAEGRYAPKVGPEQSASVAEEWTKRGVTNPTGLEFQFSPAKLEERADKNPVFKTWFGDSWVRNEDGTPKVVFHGTRHNFTRFDVAESRDIGLHFGSDSAANSFVQDASKPEGRIFPVFLKIEHPVELGKDVFGSSMSNFEMLIDELGTQKVLSRGESRRLRQMVNENFNEAEPERYHDKNKRVAVELMRVLREKGYDGIVYPNEWEGLRTITRIEDLPEDITVEPSTEYRGAVKLVSKSLGSLSDRGGRITMSGGKSYVVFDTSQIRSAVQPDAQFSPKLEAPAPLADQQLQVVSTELERTTGHEISPEEVQALISYYAQGAKAETSAQNRTREKARILKAELDKLAQQHPFLKL